MTKHQEEKAPFSSVINIAQPRKAPMATKSLGEALEEAYCKAEESDFGSPLEVGLVEDFKAEELLEQSRRFSLDGNKIIIFQFPSGVHDRVAFTLGSLIAEAFNKLPRKSSSRSRFLYGSLEFKGLSDVYNCSRLKSKIPDSVISHDPMRFSQPRSDEPIAIEVSFRHESFVKLLQEGCHLLSPQSDVIYAFLVFLQENEQKNDVESIRLVVLERIDPLVSDLAEPPIRKCLQSPWPVSTPSSSIQTEELSLLSVKVVFDRTAGRCDLQSLPEHDDIVLDPTKISQWYGKELFNGGRISISVKELFSRLFEIINGLKSAKLN